jgi:hypothetical protein
MGDLFLPDRIVSFLFLLSETFAVPDGEVVLFERPIVSEDLLSLKDSSSDYADRVRESNVRTGDVWLGQIQLFLAASVPVSSEGHVAALNAGLVRALGTSLIQEAITFPPRTVSVAHVAVTSSGDDVEHVSSDLDDALRLAQQFQRGYNLVRRTPTRLLTREQLPPVLVTFIQSKREFFGLEPSMPLIVRLTMPELGISELQQPLVDVNHLRQATADINAGRAFLSHLDFAREASVAVLIDGDYRAGVAWAATAAETLLDDVLGHMLWEEGLAPYAAASDLALPLAVRVRKLYHGRLGGRWDIRRSGAIQDWHEGIAGVRHLVVHRGYEPSQEQASLALSSMEKLIAFVVDRFAAPRNVARYPLTAVNLLGLDELERRNLITKKVRLLQQNQGESRNGIFRRWRAATYRYRDQVLIDEVAGARQMSLVLVGCPSGKRYWCLHDSFNHRAVEMQSVDDLLTAHHMSSMEEALAALATDKSRHVSIAAPLSARSGARVMRVREDWSAENLLVPGTGVMVDMTDMIHA